MRRPAAAFALLGALGLAACGDATRSGEATEAAELAGVR